MMEASLSIHPGSLWKEREMFECSLLISTGQNTFCINKSVYLRKVSDPVYVLRL